MIDFRDFMPSQLRRINQGGVQLILLQVKVWFTIMTHVSLCFRRILKKKKERNKERRKEQIKQTNKELWQVNQKSKNWTAEFLTVEQASKDKTLTYPKLWPVANSDLFQTLTYSKLIYSKLWPVQNSALFQIPNSDLFQTLTYSKLWPIQTINKQ